MLRAFHANMKAGLKRASVTVKLRFLDSCVLPIARSRWARWSYTKQTANKLDALQRSMIAAFIGIVPNSGEEYEAFFTRRHTETSTLALQSGLWSKHWATSIVSWSEHIERGHDERAWSPSLLQWQNSNWLLVRRYLLPGSATRTRVCRGRPFTRWEEGLEAAKLVTR